MDAMTRVFFIDDNGDKFYGEGPCRLLALIEETGSLRKAAISMGMAYTKALRILNRAEEVLGYPLTERTVGGSSGGGTCLTQKGKEWNQKYAAYRNACTAANRALYLEFFSDQRQEAPAPDRHQRSGENVAPAKTDEGYPARNHHMG